MPTQMVANYGVNLSPMGIVIYQFWGAALIGIGLMSWSARNIKELSFQKMFALSLFIMNATSFIIALRGQYAGANNFGWSTVAIYLFLAIGFGLFSISISRRT
jgi:hypothetical protein